MELVLLGIHVPKTVLSCPQLFLEPATALRRNQRRSILKYEEDHGKKEARSSTLRTLHNIP